MFWSEAILIVKNKFIFISVGSSFLNRGITFASFNSSVKMPVFNTWLINKLSGCIIAGSMILINFEDIPSNPQLFVEGFLCLYLLNFTHLLGMCLFLVRNISIHSVV